MTHLPKKSISTRTTMIIGYASLALLIGGLGGWSSLSQISGAVIATGQVEVDGHRQVVEHPDGGVVANYTVEEGASVLAGDPLIQLDVDGIQSDLVTVDSQLFETLVRRDRLTAEQDGKRVIEFGADVQSFIDHYPEFADRVAGQESLFDARRRSYETQVNQLTNQLQQIGLQITHAEREIASLEKQFQLIQSELEVKVNLRSKSLVSEPEILALQREAARLDGTTQSAERMASNLRGQESEVRLEIEKTTSQFREAAIMELRDIRAREADLTEQRVALRETLDRSVIRAPASGTVYGLTLRGSGDVIRPAEPILSIVPSDAGLVVIGRLPVIDVEQVFIGQRVQLRFAALPQSNLPEILGTVTRVSADAINPEPSGEPYFEVEVETDADALAGLGDLTIVPGMPVEAFIQTGERTPLTYLLDPLSNFFSGAMIES